MHGLIHVILKQFILSKYDESHWSSILAKLSIEDDSRILELKQYDDSVSVAGISAAAEVLCLSIDDVLRAYGIFFVEFIHLGGYLRMLKSMGDNIHTFLHHINDLHHNLEREFRNSDFPIFSVDALVEETEGESKTTFVLSYSSSRGSSIAALVEGILPALAGFLHNQTVEMKRLDSLKPVHVDAAWQVVTWDNGTTANDTTYESVQQKPGQQDRNVYKLGRYWHSVLMSCCQPIRQTKNLATTPSAGQPSRSSIGDDTIPILAADTAGDSSCNGRAGNSGSECTQPCRVTVAAAGPRQEPRQLFARSKSEKCVSKTKPRPKIKKKLSVHDLGSWQNSLTEDQTAELNALHAKVKDAQRAAATATVTSGAGIIGVVSPSACSSKTSCRPLASCRPCAKTQAAAQLLRDRDRDMAVDSDNDRETTAVVDLLMRSTTARRVACEWTDLAGLDVVSSFWESNQVHSAA
jgi:hypothetical protein